MGIPEDLMYTKDHEWARVDGNIVRVGITDYAQQELGDIVFVETSDTGTVLDSGESFGTVESVKAVSDLYAPVSGTIYSINSELEESPELVNLDCYGKGWMIEIEIENETEIEGLMDANAYEDYVAEEAK